MTPYERFYNVLKNPLVIVAYIVLVLLAYFFVDQSVATYFHQLDLSHNLPVLNWLTALGKWKIYILILGLAGLYFHFIQKNTVYESRSWYLLGCVLIPNIVGFIIKICLSRARPELFFEHNSYGFYFLQTKDLYWSLPSGHAVTVFGFVCGIGLVFPRFFYPVLILAFLVALSRIVLCQHYVSDVMSGFYLSILVAGLFTDYLRNKNYLNKIKSL